MVIDARSYERQRGQERAGGAYARNYVRTYVCKAYVRTYVPTVSPTYVRTHVMGCGADFVSLTYARVRAYVLFHLPRTYARTYVLFHLPPCATYCFTCHVRTHVRTYCFHCHVRWLGVAKMLFTMRQGRCQDALHVRWLGVAKMLRQLRQGRSSRTLCTGRLWAIAAPPPRPPVIRARRLGHRGAPCPPPRAPCRPTPTRRDAMCTIKDSVPPVGLALPRCSSR